MTQRRHEATIKCEGCGKMFGIIQHSHIALCQGLIDLGVKNRDDYKRLFGPTMSQSAMAISLKNIKNFNDSLGADGRKAHAAQARKVAVSKYPNMSSIGGKSGAKSLWSKEGQKQRHTERLVSLNRSGFMQQKPNKLEQYFWDLVGTDKVEFVSFKFWKTVKKNGEVKNITPDFRLKNSKAVIEVFGNYWHSPEEEQQRISLWESSGLNCLVVWENDLRKNPKLVLEKFNKFVSRNLHECPTPSSNQLG